MEFETYDYNHMAYMCMIKLKILDALQYLEDPTTCSKEDAKKALKEAIYYIGKEEMKSKSTSTSS